jgi:hypothetical protein
MYELGNTCVYRVYNQVNTISPRDTFSEDDSLDRSTQVVNKRPLVGVVYNPVSKAEKNLKSPLPSAFKKQSQKFFTECRTYVGNIMGSLLSRICGRSCFQPLKAAGRT